MAAAASTAGFYYDMLKPHDDQVIDVETKDHSPTYTPSAEWEKLVQEKGIVSWYTNAVKTPPEDVLERINGSPPIGLLPILQLEECICDTERHNRVSSPVRTTLEDKIVNDVKKATLAKKPEEVVRLLSIGSGGLLQDWYIIGKLICEGYKNIDVTFIDPSSITTECLFSFHALENGLKLEGITLTSHRFFSLTEFLNNSIPVLFDVGYAIDFDGMAVPGNTAWNDLIQSQELLQEGSHLYLSYSNEVVMFEKNGFLESIDRGWFANALVECALYSRKNKTKADKEKAFHISLESSEQEAILVAQVLYFTSDLLKEGYTNIIIDIPHSELFSISKENVFKLFKLVTPVGTSVELRFLKEFHETESSYDCIFLVNPKFLQPPARKDDAKKTFQHYRSTLKDDGECVLYSQGYGISRITREKAVVCDLCFESSIDESIEALDELCFLSIPIGPK